MYVTATELKNNLGKYLELIKKDDSIVVTKNGEPIAMIVPFVQNKKAALDNLVGLVNDTGLTLEDLKSDRLARQ